LIVEGAEILQGKALMMHRRTRSPSFVMIMDATAEDAGAVDAIS
jgi:hypothetical protein